jgi:hypothetical protein
VDEGPQEEGSPSSSVCHWPCINARPSTLHVVTVFKKARPVLSPFLRTVWSYISLLPLSMPYTCCRRNEESVETPYRPLVRFRQGQPSDMAGSSDSSAEIPMRVGCKLDKSKIKFIHPRLIYRFCTTIVRDQAAASRALKNEGLSFPSTTVATGVTCASPLSCLSWRCLTYI